MVARPAVFPYSSTTITMWVFSCCIWRIRSLTGLLSGTNEDLAHQLPHPAPGALLLLQLEHVAHVHEPDHPVDVLLVNRNARILLVDDELAELLERGIGGDGHDVGARRHHLAHHFIAELHHRLDQLAILLFDQPLFGAGDR